MATKKKAAATKSGTAQKTVAKKASGKKPEAKLSALEAAAKVLAETGDPMTSKALIEAMAMKGYWKSPGGATPHHTPRCSQP